MEELTMNGSFRKRGCTCPKGKGKRCNCGATWSFRIELPKDAVTGRRRQKEGYGFKTRAEAVTAAAKLHTELTYGKYIVEKKINFEDFSDIWIKEYESSGKVKGSTVDIRRSKLKIILTFFSKIIMKDITKSMYQDMLDDLKMKGYARKTVASVHETGKLLFKKAIEKEVIIVDPTTYATVPIYNKSVSELENEVDVPKYLEKEELALFLRTAKEKGKRNDYIVFLVLAYTGLRVGELCVLKWRDINFDEQTISVNKTIYNKKTEFEEYQLTPPKTKASKRVIDVDPIVLEELEKHKAKQERIKSDHPLTYHNENFVFATENFNFGQPETQVKVRNKMVRLLEIAKLPALAPHSLRHTFTSLCAEAGVDLETIMSILGHQSDVQTKNVYLHVTKARKKEASRKLGDLMKGLE